MNVNDTWLQALALGFLRKNQLTAQATDKPSIKQMNAKNWTGRPAPQVGSSNGWLTFSDTDAALRGSSYITWETVNLTDLFKNVNPEVFLYNPKTKHEVAAALIKRYGLPLTVDLFVDGVLSFDSLPTTVNLWTYATHSTVSPDDRVPNSGIISVKVSQADVSVADLFKQTTLTAPGVPYKPLSRRTVAELSYGTDFTPVLPEQYKQLVKITAGPVTSTLFNSTPFTTLVSLINERFELGQALWDTGTTEDYNFSLASVIYNGKPGGFIHPEGKPWSPGADGRFDNVCVIKFDETSESRVGYGFFHYYEVS